MEGQNLINFSVSASSQSHAAYLNTVLDISADENCPFSKMIHKFLMFKDKKLVAIAFQGANKIVVYFKGTLSLPMVSIY